MKKLLKTVVTILSLLILIFTISGCENNLPVDYTKDYYVEAYIFVDHPIEGIKVMSTQPVDKKFSYDNSLVKNAIVIINDGSQTMNLIYRDGENAGYFFPDTSYKVQPNTTYNLEVRTADGKVLTGETHTPSQFDWVIPPKPVIYYPKDTNNLKPVDSLNIEWTKNPENGAYYLIETLCYDTLEYGKYLEPSTTEKNRRAYNFFTKHGDEQNYYKNVTSWALVANIKTPTVWIAFKWFGKHSLRIYSADKNMLNWFMNFYFTGTTYTDPNLNSIKGGYGVFGSAAYISAEIFLMKNQE